MVVIAQFIPVCVPNLNGLSAKGVCKIISVCTCTCTCVELINMGVSRRWWNMSMWMSGLFSTVSASHTHLCTRRYCLLLHLCNFMKTHNIDMVSAKRGLGSQWVPCYQLILVKSSSSPFRCVLRVKTQIVTHLQNVISIIHSIQSTWSWEVWILVWLWLWLRAYMIICKSLNFSEFILYYL